LLPSPQVSTPSCRKRGQQHGTWDFYHGVYYHTFQTNRITLGYFRKL
jgi:hypothetical protein